jgi:protein-S-isoprenylcysteine O-methyltransferase Ste14
MIRRSPNSPGVRFPPPLLFVPGIVAGVLMNRVAPLPVSATVPPVARVVLAWAAIAAGLAGVIWAMSTFIRARTAIYPNEPARVIVSAGPYRFSRNPMYVSLATLTIGIALWLDSVWVLVLLPVALVALTRLVIRKEEAYLSSAFPEPYAAYCGRVRRWL